MNSILDADDRPAPHAGHYLRFLIEVLTAGEAPAGAPEESAKDGEPDQDLGPPAVRSSVVNGQVRSHAEDTP